MTGRAYTGVSPYGFWFRRAYTGVSPYEFWFRRAYTGVSPYGRAYTRRGYTRRAYTGVSPYGFCCLDWLWLPRCGVCFGWVTN